LLNPGQANCSTISRHCLLYYREEQAVYLINVLVIHPIFTKFDT
jgi:hypothetical protein